MSVSCYNYMVSFEWNLDGKQKIKGDFQWKAIKKSLYIL